MNFNDEYIFPNLTKLIKLLLSMPHANADAERLLSIITDVKSRDSDPNMYN